MANFYLQATKVVGRAGREFLPGTPNPETLQIDFKVLAPLTEPTELSFGSQLLLNFGGALLIVDATLLNEGSATINLSSFLVGSILVLRESFINDNAKLVSTIIQNRHALGVMVNQLNTQLILVNSNFSVSLDILL